MTPSKLLYGQIVLTFTIVIGAVWGATQWAAHMLGYQPRLGPAFYRLVMCRLEELDSGFVGWVDFLEWLKISSSLDSTAGKMFFLTSW